MQTIYVSPDFPLNRRMRKSVQRGKLNVVREDETGGGNTNTAPKNSVWRSIEGMPAQFDKTAQAAEHELRMLAKVWREQKSQLDQKQLSEFNRKLNREWAIETGLIERAYILDRGTTQLLIEQGIVANHIKPSGGQNPAQVARMLLDHENVIEGLFEFVRGQRELTIGYVKETHAAMLRSQKTVVGFDQFGNPTSIPLLHGQFKKMENNPTIVDGSKHVYCPPEFVVDEMERLINMHKAHMHYSPLAQAAWLHHRFVQIHPFQDGNGRVARCLATLVFIRADWFPLVVLNEERDMYLNALRDADNGDLSPLVRFFAERQKWYFRQAQDIAGKSLSETSPESHYKLREDDWSFLEQKVQQHNILAAKNYTTAITTARALHILAVNVLETVTAQIEKNLTGNDRAWVTKASDDSENHYYFWHQTAETATALGYYANRNVHQAWVRLILQAAGKRASLFLFFHGIGRMDRGFLACAACFVMQHGADDNEGWTEKDLTPLGNGVFQINYQEEEEQAKRRFEAWLDEIVKFFRAQVREKF